MSDNNNDTVVLQALVDALDASTTDYRNHMMMVERNREIVEADKTTLLNVRKRGKSMLDNDTLFGYFEAEMSSLKDLNRTMLSALPNITSPFITDDDSIVSMSGKSSEAQEAAFVVESLVNKQFSKGHNVNDMMSSIGMSLMTDGTVVLQSGWGENGGKMKQIPLEEIIMDSRAKAADELEYVIRRRLVPVSDVINNRLWYGNQSLDSLKDVGAYAGGSEYDFSGDGDDSDINYEENERLREMIELFEFHGALPIDGVMKSVVAIFNHDTLLTIRDNPHGDRIPFTFIPYTNKPFSIYGGSLVDLIGDLAAARSALLKNIMSVLNNSSGNAGQLFIPMDMLAEPAEIWNLKGGKDVLVKPTFKKEMIATRDMVQVSQDVFVMMKELQEEINLIAGVSRIAVDPRALNSGTSATAVNLVNSAEEARTMSIIRNMSSGMEEVFKHWLELNSELLERDAVTVKGELIEVEAGSFPIDYDISITVGTTGLRQQKLATLSAMMNSMTSNGMTIPPNILAQQARLMGLPKLAQEIEEGATQELAQLKGMVEQLQQQLQMTTEAAQTMQGELQEQQGMEQMIEMSSVRADNQAKQAKTALDMAKAQEIQVNTYLKPFELQAMNRLELLKDELNG